MSVQPVARVDLPGVPLFRRGKVREVFDLGEHLLIVATDRISAFDYILPTPIPDKGKILTQLSLFWFDFTSGIVENHLITGDVDQFPRELRGFREVLEKRSMLVKKAERIDVECVVRGYLAGGGFKEYREKGSVSGVPLPKGLPEGARLPQPIFTPATKASSGHDVNISYEEMVRLVGKELSQKIRDISLEIYKTASSYGESRGIIIADTKFEFGIIDGELILIDEILTPDSSRFWPRASYQPGGSQVSFDKQFVRDYLESIGWDKKPPVPELPPDIVEKTREKYLEAYRRLTGREEL
ncbi:MAG: phosphoribosylaminoimidazolesuccinocarboxamide synthase [Acidobacteria bacterium]|nr:phosphoribosylaminoimidazolesuccinocarboxamide synthase [Acidobacteriota bacterium]